MKYDDGFVAYLNGTLVAEANAPTPPGWDSRATLSHSDRDAVVFESFDVAGGVELLRAGENVLAIHGLNTVATSSDFLLVPELVALSDAGPGIRIERTTRVMARTLSGAEWSALSEAVFFFGDSRLRVTEIMYHPPDPPPESEFSGEDFEFVELQNVGDHPLNLTGVRFSQGIRFTFPDTDAAPERDLPPGETVLVVRRLAAFASRYATGDLSIAGEYEGRLSNGGERLVLEDRSGKVLMDFAYQDTWYPLTDGGGSSLEIIDPTADQSTWNEAAAWRASPTPLGTPGEAPHLPPPGGSVPFLRGDPDDTGSSNITDAVVILNFLFGGASEPTCLEAADTDNDGTVNISDPIRLLNFLFGGAEPLEPPVEGCGPDTVEPTLGCVYGSC